MSQWTSPLLCRVVESVGNRGNHSCRLLARDLLLNHQSRQIASLHEFRDDIAEAGVRSTAVIDWHNAGMVEAGENFGFGQIRFDCVRCL